MKVKDLIKVLQTHYPDAEVICAQDAEGNDYKPLYEVGAGHYDGHEFRTQGRGPVVICLWPAD